LKARHAIVLPALLLAVEAMADDHQFGYEITPFAGYRFGGEFQEDGGPDTVEVDDGGSFGLILNGPDSSETQWEILYSYQAAQADTTAVPGIGASNDLDIHYFQLGGTYQWDGRVARPFLSAGVGGTHVNPDAGALESDTFWSFSIGTGLQFRPGERWGVRLEARAFATLTDSDSRLFCQSGIEGGQCAFLIDGDVFWQVEAFAGLIFRF
jgi:opacity protein-like surface antigen